MQTLNEQEIHYLDSQVLGRIATADANGQPHATPVGFRYNSETGTIDVGGYELESIKPWRPRGVTIRGTAVLYEDRNAGDGGPFGSSWIRIIPERIISWGLDTPAFTDR